MPNNKCRSVKFDREHIRSQIPKLDYREARRLRGPIYKVLLQDLYEEDCKKTAKHYESLLEKEVLLLERRIIIRRVSEVPKFLTSVVDKFMLAEQSTRLGPGNGMLAALELYYQALLLMEKQRTHYIWLMAELYDIVIDIVDRLEPEYLCYNEIKMRIYYRFGKFLESTGATLPRAALYLDKAFDLAKGETWAPDLPPEKDVFSTMHEAIPRLLAQAILKEAGRVLKRDPQGALDLASKAVCALAAVSFADNKFYLIEALICKVLFMMECKKYEDALFIVEKIEPYLVNEQRSEFDVLKCRLYFNKGTCFHSLNILDKAMDAFCKGYAVSSKHNDLKADLLQSIGIIMARYPQNINSALEVYRRAKKIYTELDERKKKRKTAFLMAKLKVDKILPELVDFFKSPEFCQLHRLRQWRNLCIPFWSTVTTTDPLLSPDVSVEKIVLDRKSEADQEYPFSDIKRTRPYYEFIHAFKGDYALHANLSDKTLFLRRGNDSLDCLLREFEQQV